MFEQVRHSIDTLESVARELDPRCLDGRDAAALVDLSCPRRANLLVDQVAGGAPRRRDQGLARRRASQRRARGSRCSHIQELS